MKDSCFSQSLIQSARVMVVGCGALGNEVLKNLVLMGVEHIVAVDFDVVEMGNLSRGPSPEGRRGGRAPGGHESGHGGMDRLWRHRL